MNRKQIVGLACLAVVMAAPGWSAEGDAPVALEPGTVSRFSPGAAERIQVTIELPGESRTVYLGARVYILSNPPGTILRELDVPPPDRPAREMQRESEFVETVFGIRETIELLEAENPRRVDVEPGE